MNPLCLSRNNPIASNRPITRRGCAQASTRTGHKGRHPCMCTILNNYITATYHAHFSAVAGESSVQCLTPWQQILHAGLSGNSTGGQWQNCTTCRSLAAYSQSVQLRNFTGNCQRPSTYILATYTQTKVSIIQALFKLQ